MIITVVDVDVVDCCVAVVDIANVVVLLLMLLLLH